MFQQYHNPDLSMKPSWPESLLTEIAQLSRGFHFHT